MIPQPQAGKKHENRVGTFFRDNWRTLVYLGLAIVLMFKIIQAPGIIGFHHDWGFPYDSNQGQLYFNQFFHFWRPDDLGKNPVYPSDYVYRLVVGVIAFLGAKGPVLAKFLVFICLVLSAVFMDGFLTAEGYSSSAALTGSLFYMLSPVMFNKLLAGHLLYTMAYAISPLALRVYLQAGRSRQSGYWAFIPAGLLVAIAGIQIQYMPMLGLIMAIVAATAPAMHRRRLFVGLGVVVGMSVLVHLAWLLPLTSSSNASQVAAGAATFSWLEHNSNTWADALRLVGYRAGGLQFEKQIGDGSLWPVVSYLVPVVALVGGWLGRRHHLVRASVTIAVVGVIISVGAAWPLGPIVQWLFLHVPMITMFREFYHLAFVPAIGYATLLAVFAHNMDLSWPTLRASTAVLLIVAIYATPFANGGLSANFHVVPRDAGAAAVQKALASDPDDFRVLWTPLVQPLRPPDGDFSGIDPEVKSSVKPVMPQEIAGGRGVAAENFAVSQYSQLLTGNTSTVARELSLAGVKYVVDRPALRSDYPAFTFMSRYPDLVAQWTSTRVSDAIAHTPGFAPAGTYGGATVYANQAWSPITQVLNRPVLAGGELTDLGIVLDTPVGSTSGVVLATQAQGVENATLVVPNDSWLDIVGSYLQPKYRIEPGRMTTVENDAAQGWISAGYWWWFSPSIAGLSSNGTFTLAQGATHEFAIGQNPGSYALLAKVLSWPKGGSVSFSWGGKTSRVATLTESTNYHWIDLGDFDFHGEPIRLTNQLGANVVAEFIVAPRSQLEAAQKQAKQAAEQNSAVLMYTDGKVGGAPNLELPFDKEWLEALDTTKYAVQTKPTGEMVVKAQFGSDQDEYGTLYHPVDLNLQQFPTMSLTYSVDDPAVSAVQVGLDMDYDGDGIADKTAWGDSTLIEKPAPTTNREWRIDVRQVATRSADGATNLHLVGVRLLLHKLWGVKKAALTKPAYTFTMQRLAFAPAEGLTALSTDKNLEPTSIMVPVAKSYDVFIRMAKPVRTNATAQVGQAKVESGERQFDSAWVKLGTVKLAEGDTRMAIATTRQRALVQAVALVPQGMAPFGEVSAQVQRHSFDRYDVDLQTPAKGGEFLVFRQAFDEGWVLKADGHQVKPVMANGYANGFVLPAGAKHLSLSYKPQALYITGMVLGWGAIGCLLGLWAYLVRRRKLAVDLELNRPSTEEPRIVSE